MMLRPKLADVSLFHIVYNLFSIKVCYASALHNFIILLGLFVKCCILESSKPLVPKGHYNAGDEEEGKNPIQHNAYLPHIFRENTQTHSETQLSSFWSEIQEQE